MRVGKAGASTYLLLNTNNLKTNNNTMKNLIAQFNYIGEIKLTKDLAEKCYHTGDCMIDIKEAIETPFIKKQLDKINPEQLKKELYNYGAWDNEELSIHSDNLARILWIAAGDVLDNN